MEWKGTKEEKIKNKKAVRKEDQTLTDKEEGREKKTRTFARKRGQGKERCELSDEEREEKEAKLRRKLRAESAEHESISDTDLCIFSE